MPTRVRSIHFEPGHDGVFRATLLDEIMAEDPVTQELRPTGTYIEPRTVVTAESHPEVFAAVRVLWTPAASDARNNAKRQERLDRAAQAAADAAAAAAITPKPKSNP